MKRWKTHVLPCRKKFRRDHTNTVVATCVFKGRDEEQNVVDLEEEKNLTISSVLVMI